MFARGGGGCSVGNRALWSRGDGGVVFGCVLLVGVCVCLLLFIEDVVVG